MEAIPRNSHKGYLIYAAILPAILLCLCTINPAQAYATDLTAASVSSSGQTLSPVTVYRLYNRWSGEHLYTLDTSEYNKLEKIGWKKEGVAWVAPPAGDPVYRLYNPYSGDHHYTTDEAEYKKLGTIGWKQEGRAWYSADSRASAIYRGFNRYVTVGTHHYTIECNEINNMVTHGWKDEGIGWYGYRSMEEAIANSIPIPAQVYKARYSYQVYMVNTGVAETYNDAEYALYVKTNNPDPQSLELIDASTRERVSSIYTDFEDVDSESVAYGYYFARRVQGGYIMTLKTGKAGARTFQLVEKSSKAGAFYNGKYQVYLNTSLGSVTVPHNVENRFFTVVGSFKLNVVDWDTAQSAWFDSIIAKSTSAGMSPLQKMDAAVAYINDNEGFKYTTLNEDKQQARFAKHPVAPFFAYKHCTSYSSPAILCELARHIGGFDNIHNCYNDYPNGSSGWYSTHYLMTCTYKGTTHSYTICPSMSTGIIPSSDKLDFNDMSQFRRLS